MYKARSTLERKKNCSFDSQSVPLHRTNQMLVACIRACIVTSKSKIQMKTKCARFIIHTELQFRIKRGLMFFACECVCNELACKCKPVCLLFKSRSRIAKNPLQTQSINAYWAVHFFAEGRSQTVIRYNGACVDFVAIGCWWSRCSIHMQHEMCASKKKHTWSSRTNTESNTLPFLYVRCTVHFGQVYLRYNLE